MRIPNRNEVAMTLLSGLLTFLLVGYAQLPECSEQAEQAARAVGSGMPPPPHSSTSSTP